MVPIWLFTILVGTLLFSYFLSKKIFLAKNEHKNLPPSPPSLPIIGHLHLLTKQPLIHRTFQQLSLQYGSIFSLNLGIIPCVIISSNAAVEECFTKNDMILANRPKVLSGKYLHYDWTTLGAAPYGPLWLNLRRLTNQELFSGTRMNSFASLRVEEVRSLVKGLFDKSKEKFSKVEMNSMLSGLSFNILTSMLTGKKYFDYGGEINQEAASFFEIMREAFELNGVSNMGDVFPFLRRFQNIERKMVKVRRKMDGFLDGLIEECRINKVGGETTMIYKLLNLQESEPENYSNDIIKGIIMIMLMAGTDTTSATIEWALALLINHPNVLEKARKDIDNFKINGELLEEVDIPQLPYIQCIINETLRLFPTAPLLVGHAPSQDINISGYHIEKGKTCLINAWQIHRDPNLWDDPLKYMPERFEGLKNEDYKFSYIPFGLGRRSCPGGSLANRVVGLTLGSLIQCFDWETIVGKEVDLTEGVGLTMPKAKPLEVMCRPRKSINNVLTKM